MPGKKGLVELCDNLVYIMKVRMENILIFPIWCFAMTIELNCYHMVIR
jgi:hypothetical protein